MKWINVKDRLPGSGCVLVLTKDRDTLVAERDGSTWICNCNCSEGSYADDVTHWMPLPEPPKEGE